MSERSTIEGMPFAMVLKTFYEWHSAPFAALLHRSSQYLRTARIGLDPLGFGKQLNSKCLSIAWEFQNNQLPNVIP